MAEIGGSNITGIVSGLDTNAIVEAIINSERGPARLLEGRVTEVTNKVTVYKAVEAKFLAIQSRLATLGQSKTFDKMSFSVSDPDAVSVAVSGTPATGSFDMRVLQLARNHQIASQGIDDATATIVGTGEIQISVGGGSIKTIEITEANNTLMGIRDAINASGSGVTASIINDGSSTNSHRLVLSSNKTGAKNTISFNSTLTGGVGLDFTTSSFDAPETTNFSSLATSTVSLGGTAAYSGTDNKTYTFTIRDTGELTVGTDVITIDWTDGTNSGSVQVTQADDEVTLAGTGSDGLKLSFSAGKLIGGDTFTVQSFSPTLQKPGDAKISVGSSSSGGSPIIVSSATNEFDQTLPGMKLTARKITAENEVVSISATRDNQGIRGEIQGFIDAYNDAMKFVDQQYSYDATNEKGGALITETLLRTMQEVVRSAATGIVSNATSSMNALAKIGIRSDGKGQLKIVDSAALDKAISENIQDLKKLFVKDIVSSRPEIQFLSAPDSTKDGADYKVDITQAASQAVFTGSAITDPSVTPLVIDANNKTFKIIVDGRESDDITLSEGTYTSFDQLMREIQNRIDADEKVGAMGVSVDFSATGGTGSFTFTTGSYGSKSTISFSSDSDYVSAGAILGFSSGSLTAGKDVAGTINGEEAEGTGQTLSGKAGNATTDGVTLKITLTDADVVAGAEGTFKFVRGVSARVKDAVFRITDSTDGSIGRRTKALNAQITDFKEQIKRIDQRLQLKRARLVAQFQAMEEALSQLGAQGQYLANNLSSISSNFR